MWGKGCQFFPNLIKPPPSPIFPPYNSTPNFGIQMYFTCLQFFWKWWRLGSGMRLPWTLSRKTFPGFRFSSNLHLRTTTWNVDSVRPFMSESLPSPFYDAAFDPPSSPFLHRESLQPAAPPPPRRRKKRKSKKSPIINTSNCKYEVVREVWRTPYLSGVCVLA